MVHTGHTLELQEGPVCRMKTVGHTLVPVHTWQDLQVLTVTLPEVCPGSPTPFLMCPSGSGGRTATKYDTCGWTGALLPVC